LVAHGRQPIL